jgi:hypothetical protein
LFYNQAIRDKNCCKLNDKNAMRLWQQDKYLNRVTYLPRGEVSWQQQFEKTW